MDHRRNELGPSAGERQAPGTPRQLEDGKAASERDGTQAQRRPQQLLVDGLWLIYPPQCQRFKSLSLVW